MSVRVNADERRLLEDSGQAGQDQAQRLRSSQGSRSGGDRDSRHPSVVIPAKDWEKFEAWVSAPPRRSRPCVSSPEPLPHGRINATPTAGCRRRQGCLRRRTRLFEPVVPPPCLAQSGFWNVPHQRHGRRGHRRDRWLCHTVLGADRALPRLPKSAQRNRPDPIPVILLGQLAVDKRYQGKGCARSLLFFALKTAVRLAKDVGCYAVVTHPLDDDVRAFYAQFGFEDLPYDPAHAMAVRIADLKQSGF